MTDPNHSNVSQSPPPLWLRFLIGYMQFWVFLMRRVVALWFMVLGSLATLMATLWVLMGKPIDVNHVPHDDIGTKLLYIGAFLLPTVIGWLLWRMKPVDPENNFLKRTFDKMVKAIQ